MSVHETLERRLLAQTADNPLREPIAETVAELSIAAAAISRLIRRGALAGRLGADMGEENAGGDTQKELDVAANDLVLDALRRAPVAYYASEEEDAILTLNDGAALAVAVDPLDGSSNIDVNVSIGTIFSIFPAEAQGATASFFRPGSEQVAAGYFIYGPQTALVLTMGDGVDVFVLDPDDGLFKLAQRGLCVPPTAREFAINASNYRHWGPEVRAYIDDVLEGATGPTGKNFNMRWVASLVAETHRIMSRGGVFLYPGDEREGYEHGRLRLLYEAFPIAMLAEQAGGKATNGPNRILDETPVDLHQRSPLIFGSPQKVDRVTRYYADPAYARSAISPLFGRRGLFRQ